VVDASVKPWKVDRRRIHKEQRSHSKKLRKKKQDGGGKEEPKLEKRERGRRDSDSTL
jgi:hypothetical protein